MENEEGPDALRTSEKTDKVAPDPIDGAVAAAARWRLLKVTDSTTFG